MNEYKKSPELKKAGQAKWLSDDYVKFLRFAQWRIEQTGYGVLGFVTNHMFQSNPTFLDMRASLMATFDDLYILDLHGSTKPKESGAPHSILRGSFVAVTFRRSVSMSFFNAGRCVCSVAFPALSDCSISRRYFLIELPLAFDSSAKDAPTFSGGACSTKVLNIPRIAAPPDLRSAN